jgi:hypothetical protein
LEFEPRFSAAFAASDELAFAAESFCDRPVLPSEAAMSVITLAALSERCSGGV